VTFRWRLVLALLLGLFSFTIVSAQGDHDHGGEGGEFTLPNIGQSLIEDAAETARGLWESLGISSLVAEPMNSPYTSLPNARLEDGGFVLGDPNAPVTIIEFADFGCPHCQTYKETIDQFVDEYVATGMARLEYRTFPTAGGQMTLFFGNVQECLEQQRPGAFWESYVLFYESAMAGRYSEDVAARVADTLGLDYEEALSCIETAQQVITDVNFGIENGVGGTPAVMIRVGDGAAQWIEYQGMVYNRGGVPFDVLAAVVESYQE
jgi:protein-disulfide isomerase